jgi:hypothetical protein
MFRRDGFNCLIAHQKRLKPPQRCTFAWSAKSPDFVPKSGRAAFGLHVSESPVVNTYLVAADHRSVMLL